MENTKTTDKNDVQKFNSFNIWIIQYVILVYKKMLSQKTSADSSPPPVKGIPRKISTTRLICEIK